MTEIQAREQANLRFEHQNNRLLASICNYERQAKKLKNLVNLLTVVIAANIIVLVPHCIRWILYALGIY